MGVDFPDRLHTRLRIGSLLRDGESPDAVILSYHSLDASGGPFSTAPERFSSQMEQLAAAGRPVVPLSRIASTPGAVALTFDDGYRDFLDHGFPVLEHLALPATVFVVAGFIGKRAAWDGASGATELMNAADLRSVADAGLEIGSHSIHHRELPRLSNDEVGAELRHSRAMLEDCIGRPVRAFAYPYGSSDRRVRDLTAEHYQLACGVQLSFVRRDSDPYHLPRIDAQHLCPPLSIEAARVVSHRFRRRLARLMRG